MASIFKNKIKKRKIRKTIIDGIKDKESLQLSNIGDGDVKFLAQALKGSQITTLDLCDSNIGCNGLKHLAQVLGDTQITTLNLDNTNIMDEGVIYLTEYLKDTQITHLDLSRNKTGVDAAQHINEMLANTKIETLHLDIYYTEHGNADAYILQTLYDCDRDIRYIHITLRNNKIGIKGAQYLNKTFQNISIGVLELDSSQNLEADDAQYLAQAFKSIKISMLCLCHKHIMQLNGIQYLVQAFENSRIARLNVNSQKLETTGVKYLSEFLKKVKVLDLRLFQNYIRDEGIKYLVPVLQNSDIMFVHLSRNDITAQGAMYLSKILQNSKILYLDLRCNHIGDNGAKYLANGLRYSQVTSINLYGNEIEQAGCQYLIDIIDDSNLSWVNLHFEDLEAGVKISTKPSSSKGRSRSTTTINSKIRHAFRKLVSLNPVNNEFEFMVPETDDIDQYAFLIGTLKDNQNTKVHVFDMMCNKDHYNFDIMDKINKFISIIQERFNTFIDNKLPDLVEKFSSYNYVNLVKQFEDFKLHDVVENLLLHRILYYIDENQEILHPYIYKMLNKYNLPLYNEQLEPNKKDEIISYYQSNQEIDGIQEIIDLLESI